MSSELHVLGRSLDEVQRQILQSRGIGLTRLASLVSSKDEISPDVESVRRLLVRVDIATIAAYGLSLRSGSHGFHEYKGDVRWTIDGDARLMVLEYLLEENHRRAALQDGAIDTLGDENGDDE